MLAHVIFQLPNKKPFICASEHPHTAYVMMPSAIISITQLKPMVVFAAFFQT